MGLFRKSSKPPYDDEKARLGRNLHEAEVRYLEVLRRELANLIVAADPNLMVRYYQRAWTFESEIAQNLARAQAEEAALCAKFPMFSDFDLIGARHFVPYSDAIKIMSDDSLMERYHEVSRMLVFMRRRDDFKSKYPVHDENEFKVLEKCMQKEKDRSFRDRIEDAISRFYAYRTGLEKAGSSVFGVSHFEDAEVNINLLPSLPDNEFGIAFKNNGEFGVYSFHVFDTGEISYDFYRSNAIFSERIPLLM